MFIATRALLAGATSLADNLSTTNLVGSWRGDNVTQSGGTVSQMTDLSGSGWHLTEATNKPTYVASGPNSQPYVSFDTNTDILTNGSVSVADPCHIYMVIRQTNWTLNRYIYVDSLSHPYCIQGTSGDGSPSLVHYCSGPEGNSVDVTLNTWMLFESCTNAASSFQRVSNGTKSEATNAGAQTMAGFKLGETNLTALYDVAEVAMFSVEVTGAAHTQNVAHFNDRYSLGL